MVCIILEIHEDEYVSSRYRNMLHPAKYMMNDANFDPAGIAAGIETNTSSSVSITVYDLVFATFCCSSGLPKLSEQQGVLQR